jgi:magnesium-protoporphyrin O-methyltransferase
MQDYMATRDRVEGYFDRTATTVWARLTSDAPVSRVRQTVREGRDAMRALMLDRLPFDLRGARVLDAGCGTGAMTAELARRGADVMAVDIAPQLIDIAAKRLPAGLPGRVAFQAGDMTDAAHGRFDYVLAMDSLIYYTAPDIADIMARLSPRVARGIIFTVAPRTPLLMTMFNLGKLFPRSDRSPTMIPHAFAPLQQAIGPKLHRISRVSRGFYISECLELRP